jgi:hypothetical protein
MRRLGFGASCLLLIVGLACHSGSPPERRLARRLPDSVLARRRHEFLRQMDSIQRARDGKPYEWIIQPEGPALIAFYPRPSGAEVAGDSVLLRAIMDFRARIPRARELADGLGWEYWERHESAVQIAGKGQIAMRVGLPPPGFGFVLFVPGYPPRVIPGIGGDSALAPAMNQLLTELKRLNQPNRARS